MRIRRIDIIPLNILLTEPFEISLETVTTANNVIIRLHNDELIGIGESSPFQSILGESQKGQIEIAKLLALNILREPIRSIEEMICRMDQIIAFNHGIKSAFDMALHDLWGQSLGKPLYRLLGAKEKKPLITDMTLGIQPIHQSVQRAVEFAEAGFDALKVKVGKNIIEDVERIRHIRQAIGPSIKLRIDANQGWNKNEALTALKQMTGYNIEHCEEPIASWNLSGQQDITSKSKIPIMADESLFDHHDAQRLIDFQACHSFNIKLAKSGGIYKALKIANLAGQHGMPCQVGCFSETRIGITALAHLCMASDQIKYYDMDSPLMLLDDPVDGGIQYFQNNKVVIPEDRDGLGVTLNLSYIDQDQMIVVE